MRFKHHKSLAGNLLRVSTNPLEKKIKIKIKWTKKCSNEQCSRKPLLIKHQCTICDEENQRKREDVRD